MKDLRADLIARARKLAVTQKPDHPWAEMTDAELVKSHSYIARIIRAEKQGCTGSRFAFGEG